jgi:hypothetical protein
MMARPMVDAGRFHSLRKAYGRIGAATTLRIACASLLLQLLVLSAWAVFGRYRGPNYTIYKYFADLWVSGVNVFDPGAMPYAVRWTYLDYTPANFLVYRVLFAGGDLVDAIAFIAYQIGALGLGLVLLRGAVARGALSLRTFQLIAVLVAFNPFLTARVILVADDKALYFLVPVAIIVLWDKRDSLLANAAIGLLGAWIGSGLGILAWRGLTLVGRGAAPQGAARRLAAVSALLVGAVLAICPYMPQSAILFQNRVDRESAPPFWYSLFRFVDPVFAPWQPKVLGPILVAGIFVAALKRRLSDLGAIILLSSVYLLVSNSSVWSRAVTTIPLFLCAIRSPAQERMFALCAVWFGGMFLLDRLGFFVSYPQHAELGPRLVAGMVLVHLPIVVGWVLALLAAPEPQARDLR